MVMTWLGLKAIGYKQVLNYLDTEKDLESLEAEIAMETRRFAKRQMTFWRNEPVKLAWDLYPKEREESLRIGQIETGN